MEWDLANLLYIVSDSAGTMEKARSLVEREKKTSIGTMMAQGYPAYFLDSRICSISAMPGPSDMFMHAM
jgi:hypothetical protein